MIRIFVRLSLCAVFVFVTMNGDALAQCGTNCESQFKHWYGINDVHSLYLDPNLSPSELAAVYNAVDDWNQVYTNGGYAGGFVYVYNHSTAEIAVHEDPALAGQSDAAYTDSTQIALNPDALNLTPGELLSDFTPASMKKLRFE